jgi:SET domain-containing protein
MFIVRTSLRPSPIQGLGCFADEAISKGQVVWEFDPRLDIRISLSDIDTFPPFMRDHFRTFSYVELLDGQEILVYCADFSKHMNHSDEPNLFDTEDNLREIAIRDIAVGEELTCNYYKFDLHAAEKLSNDNAHTV